MSEFKELCARIDQVNQQLLASKQKNVTRINKIIETKQELVEEIRKIRKDINKHLDHLEEKAVNDLDTTETELQKELKANIETLENHIDKLQKLKASLEENDHHVATKNADEMLIEAKSFVNNATRMAALTLKMMPHEELVSSIINSTRLASFDFHLTEEPTLQREKLKTKRVEEVAIDDSGREHSRYISCICQLIDGTYILADTNNNELIQIDIDFEVKNTLALPDGPYGLCVLDVDEIAVRLCNKTIRIVQTRPEFTLKQTIDIGETPYSCGLAYYKGTYWSSGYRGLNLYSKDGTRVRSIVNEVNGDKPFSKGQPEDIAISKDGNEIFVTDSKDGVLVFGQTGTLRMSLRDERLQQTKGVAVTEDGLVIVAGFNSKNIIAFNPDTKASNVIATSKRLPGYPVSLHYDARLCRLLVGCNDSKLLVFEMKK